MNTTPEMVAALVRKMLRAGFAFESIEDVTVAGERAPGAFCTAAAAAINREAAAGYIAAEITDRRLTGPDETFWATLGVEITGDGSGRLSVYEVSASWEEEYPARASELLNL